MYQNVTLKLNKSLLRDAKSYAAKKGASLSGLMVEALGLLVQQSQDYERAKKSALSALKKGFKLGGGPYYSSRGELHERHGK